MNHKKCNVIWAKLGKRPTSAFFRMRRYLGAEKKWKQVVQYVPLFVAEGLLVPEWEKYTARKDHNRRFTDKGHDFYRALCIADLENAMIEAGLLT